MYPGLPGVRAWQDRLVGSMARGRIARRAAPGGRLPGRSTSRGDAGTARFFGGGFMGRLASRLSRRGLAAEDRYPDLVASFRNGGSRDYVAFLHLACAWIAFRAAGVIAPLAQHAA